MSPDAIRHRIRKLHALRQHVDDELTVLNHELSTQGLRTTRRSRTTPAKCGTDSGYQRHRYLRETACESCKAAHAQHERIKAAQKRLREAGKC